MSLSSCQRETHASAASADSVEFVVTLVSFDCLMHAKTMTAMTRLTAIVTKSFHMGRE